MARGVGVNSGFASSDADGNRLVSAFELGAHGGLLLGVHFRAERFGGQLGVEVGHRFLRAGGGGDDFEGHRFGSNPELPRGARRTIVSDNVFYRIRNYRMDDKESSDHMSLLPLQQPEYPNNILKAHDAAFGSRLFDEGFSE